MLLAGLSFRALLSNWHRVEVVSAAVAVAGVEVVSAANTDVKMHHHTMLDTYAAVVGVEVPHCVDGSAANTGLKMHHHTMLDTYAAGAGVEVRCVGTSAVVVCVASATPVPVLLADCAAHLPVPICDYYTGS
jgi:hypothetical protein